MHRRWLMLAILKSFVEENKSKLTALVIISLIIFTLGSYSMGLIAFVSPSQENRWNTEIPGINPTYSRGTTVSLNGVLEEGTQFIQNGEYFAFTAPESVRWAITIKNQANMPVYFETDIIANIQGDQLLNQKEFDIPLDAELGTYTVKLIIWNDLLPQGNTRTHEIAEASFEVTP
jgi:hypothetical protein